MASLSSTHGNFFTLSSDEEDSYITRPLGKRVAETALFSLHDAKTLKKSPLSRNERTTHCISESDDSDEPGDSDIFTKNSLSDRNEKLLLNDRFTTEILSTSQKSYIYSGTSCSSKESYTDSSTNKDSSSQKSESDLSSQKDSASSILNESELKKKPLTRVRKPASKTKNEEKEKEKERKREEKLTAKAQKDMERELKRCARPQDCLKSMILSIDEQLRNASDSEVFLNIILDNDLSFNVESNIIPHSVIWHRRVADITLVNNQVHKEEREQLENFLLLYIPSSEFVDKIQSSILQRKGKSDGQQTLLDYISEIQSVLPQTKLTCVTVGLESYIREKKASSQGDDDNLFSTQRNVGRPVKNIPKKDIDEAIVELQLTCLINYHALANMTDFGNLLARFTKAIAESPFKLQKQQQQQAFSWYAEADSSCPVKIDKDGKGILDLWQQQIQQFTSIGKEVAEAITTYYPSLLSLVNAYRSCSTEKEGEKLLQDIVVRRNYGPLGSNRRVGPELSYKMYRLFMSPNENELLQR